MKMKYSVRIAKKEQKKISINTEFIRLDAAMKLANITTTGGIAKMLIQDGLVKVNGEVCLSRGKKLHDKDTIEYERVVYTICKE